MSKKHSEYGINWETFWKESGILKKTPKIY